MQVTPGQWVAVSITALVAFVGGYLFYRNAPWNQPRTYLDGNPKLTNLHTYPLDSDTYELFAYVNPSGAAIEGVRAQVNGGAWRDLGPDDRVSTVWRGAVDGPACAVQLELRYEVRYSYESSTGLAYFPEAGAYTPSVVRPVVDADLSASDEMICAGDVSFIALRQRDVHSCLTQTPVTWSVIPGSERFVEILHSDNTLAIVRGLTADEAGAWTPAGIQAEVEGLAPLQTTIQVRNGTALPAGSEIRIEPFRLPGSASLDPSTGEVVGLELGDVTWLRVRVVGSSADCIENRFHWEIEPIGHPPTTDHAEIVEADGEGELGDSVDGTSWIAVRLDMTGGVTIKAWHLDDSNIFDLIRIGPG